MVIWYVIILLLALPIGYLLAWLARDELIAGRKWFLLLFLASIASIAALIFVDFSVKLPSILTLGFLAVISLMAIWKSADKKWTKKS